jgi:hypothetical protein
MTRSSYSSRSRFCGERGADGFEGRREEEEGLSRKMGRVTLIIYPKADERYDRQRSLEHSRRWRLGKDGGKPPVS